MVDGGIFILVREDIDHVEDALPDNSKGRRVSGFNLNSSMQNSWTELPSIYL